MDTQTGLIVASVAYLIGLPLLFWGIGFADKKLKNNKLQKKMANPGANKHSLSRDAPTPVWGKWKERLKFTRSDKREFAIPSRKKDAPPKVLPITRQKAYWLVRGLGLVIAIISGVAGNPLIFLLAMAFYFFGIIYGFKSADKLLKAREALYTRMFSTARSKLGQSSEYENNPQQIIRVLEWRDHVKPQKIEFDIPDTFGEEGMEAFMKHFNQNFGRETAWVPADNEETGEPGWDFEKGLVTIRSVPPLPQKAPWDAHYVLHEAVAWSFFPIGLGVEHGLELPNPNTGVVENVLGFDLSGEQAGLARKMGIKMGQSIVTSPMGLVAGATGGGKAMSVDTMLQVMNQSEVEAFNHANNRGKKD